MKEPTLESLTNNSSPTMTGGVEGPSEVPEPMMRKPGSDWERLQKTLETSVFSVDERPYNEKGITEILEELVVSYTLKECGRGHIISWGLTYTFLFLTR